MALLTSLRATTIRRSIVRAPPTRPAVYSQIRFKSIYTNEERYWKHIPRYQDIGHDQFINYAWQYKEIVSGQKEIMKLLHEVVPDTFTPSKNARYENLRTKQDFIDGVAAGFNLAPMALRVTPHIISRIDWNNPLDDPIRRQFIPVESGILEDHPQLTFDSLNEQGDSPVDGLVHRYPGRALFLPISHCPVYCRYCTRSWAVGANTALVPKKCSQPPGNRRWERVFKHIEQDKTIKDIVVSGGDSYQLSHENLRLIGNRLLSIPHIQRFRIASKGIAVAPGRIIDKTDPWTDEIIALSDAGRKVNKQVCIHTHFNHPREITWITRKAAAYLFEKGVIVRNQSVLLKGINDDVKTMGTLLESLSEMNIQPYYVYQCDLVRGIEDLRTPLRTILELDKTLRGTNSGFMMPSFVVDLPGGGGKRLAATHEKYDEASGISYWRAPGLPEQKGKQIYTYYDPYPAGTTNVQQVHEHQQKLVEQTIKEMHERLGTGQAVQGDSVAAESVEETTSELEKEQIVGKACDSLARLGHSNERKPNNPGMVRAGVHTAGSDNKTESSHAGTIKNKEFMPAEQELAHNKKTVTVSPKIELRESPERPVAAASF